MKRRSSFGCSRNDPSLKAGVLVKFLDITLIEVLLLLYGALDVLIRINEFMAKQEPKPTTTEYLLVNAVFFLMSVVVIITWKVYTTPKEIEEKGG